MGLKIALMMGILMAAMAGLGYWYYQDTQQKMAILHENNAKLETATKVQKETIRQIEQNLELAHNIAIETSDKLKEAREQVGVIRNKFNKTSKLLGSRDLGKMGIAKARPIKRIINSGSAKMMRCFEIMSGQPLTEKEKNAKKPSQLNGMCPGVANPNRLTGMQ
jgi:hypothetical protein